MSVTNSLEEIQKLIDIYSESQQSIIRTIAEKEARGNVTWFQKSLLAQVESLIQELNIQAKEWVKNVMPQSYQSGMDYVVSELNKLGIKAETEPFTFSQINIEAVKVLMLDTLDDLHTANKFAGDRIKQAVRQAVNEAVTQKIAQGQTVLQCKKNLVNSLLSKGIDGIADKMGRLMPLDSYASLVARSRTREATNTATMNKLTGLGHDLVKMSSHNTSCPICISLQGRVYSISGNDGRYPPLQRAFSGEHANIHPNCSHVLMPYIESLADDPEGDRKYSNMGFDVDPRSQKEVDIYNEAQRKKQRIREGRRLWESYSLALPDKTPKSFAAFMDIRRSGGEKWDNLQQEFKDATKKQ